MTKKTERIEVKAGNLLAGDVIVQYKNRTHREGSVVLAVELVGWNPNLINLTTAGHKDSAACNVPDSVHDVVTVEREVAGGGIVVDRIVVRESHRVEVEVDQEEMCVIAEGELVYIYIADEMATLSRAEWDQIVGVL